MVSVKLVCCRDCVCMLGEGLLNDYIRIWIIYRHIARRLVNLRGSGRKRTWPNEVIYPAFARMDWGILQNNCQGRRCVGWFLLRTSRIQTHNLTTTPNSSQWYYGRHRKRDTAIFKCISQGRKVLGDKNLIFSKFHKEVRVSVIVFYT